MHPLFLPFQQQSRQQLWNLSLRLFRSQLSQPRKNRQYCQRLNRLKHLRHRQSQLLRKIQRQSYSQFRRLDRRVRFRLPCSNPPKLKQMTQLSNNQFQHRLLCRQHRNNDRMAAHKKSDETKQICSLKPRRVAPKS